MKNSLQTSVVSKATKLLAMMVLLFSVQTESKAQSVDYAVKWSHAYDLGDTLTVYMRSSTSINFPFNQVSTAQVTLRVPTGMLPFFDGDGNLATNNFAQDTIWGHGNGTWSNNARFSVGDATAHTDPDHDAYYLPGNVLGGHPDGNSYDYISFGLTNLGTREIEFVAGEELPLFSFFFPEGSLCSDFSPIHVLDHVEDTVFIANGVTSPVNNMSVLGPGGNIYAANYFTEYGARCYDYDNDDVPNDEDYCDYTRIEDIEDENITIDADGCTDFDNDGFHPDDNPTEFDQDILGTPRYDSDGNEDETYNLFDPDIDDKCIPQGDSMRGYLSMFYEGTEYSADAVENLSAAEICAGDTVILIVNMLETEGAEYANSSVDASAPYDYDHRGKYNVTINSSLGGDMTVPLYTSGDSIKVTPTEDGTIFSLVQATDTFLCNAIEVDSFAQVNVGEGVTLATIDGDEEVCGTSASVNIEVNLVGGQAPFVVDIANHGSITMFSNDTVFTVTPASSVTYTLNSITDNNGNGCETPDDAMIGSAIIEFTQQASLNSSDVAITPPTECGTDDATLTISGTGGHPVGTEYSINGGVTWSTALVYNGLSAGNYVVATRVNGNDNCITTVDSVYSIASNQAPVFAQVNVFQPIDCANDTGRIEVLVQNPNGTIEYSLDDVTWVTGNQSNGHHVFYNQASGTYPVYIRYDDGSCQVAFPGGAEIDPISEPVLGTPVVNNATDCTETNGEISLLANSPDGFALEYQLDTVGGGESIWGSQNVFTNLPTGSYQINVRIAGAQFVNCLDSLPAAREITRPDSLGVTALDTDISDCSLEGTGAMTVQATVNGGASSTSHASVEYSIDGGLTWDSDGDFDNLTSGIYNVAVRNTDGTCVTNGNSSFEITIPEDILQITPTATDVTECGDTDGTVEALVQSFDAGATLEYAVLDGVGTEVEPFQASPNFSGLAGGSYQIVSRYTDLVNAICADTLSFEIEAPNEIVATAAAFDSEICGEDEGQIVINVSSSLDGAVEYSIDTGLTWQSSNIFSGGLGTTTILPQVRYQDTSCREDLNEVSLVLPEITEIVVGDVSPTNATQCGVDDARLDIDTASFTGSNFEFSIDGSTFQSDTFFTALTGGTYLLTVRNSATPSCEDTTSFVIANNTAPRLNAKVMLQGPFNNGTGLMNDDLRAKDLLPMASPYDSTNLKLLGVYDGSESNVGAAPHYNSVSLVNDPDAGNDHLTATVPTMVQNVVNADRSANSIVDWVLLELRPESDSSIISSRAVGLLQRDGDVVTFLDGESALLFRGTCANSSGSEKYWVSVKHRNHSGVMTSDPVDFGSGVVNLDFTDTELNLWKMPDLTIPMEPATVLANGKRALWGGNTQFNRRVLFQGQPPLETDVIQNKVLDHLDNDNNLTNFIAEGYLNSDVNMDGITIFQGSPNDVDIIFFNIMGNPANAQFRANFTLREQLPENQ